jgi:hypothetical protein
MNSPTPRPASSSIMPRPIPWVDLWVGCATPPVIFAAIGSQVMARAIAQMGRLGEDLLRGERLPLLHFPPDASIDP